MAKAARISHRQTICFRWLSGSTMRASGHAWRCTCRPCIPPIRFVAGVAASGGAGAWPVAAGAAADRMDRRPARFAACPRRHAGSRQPTLSGLNGAPEVGGGVNVSISHSERLAAALASPDRGYAIGVDVEAIPSDAAARDLLAERILSPAERTARHRHGSTSLDQGSRLQGDPWLDGQASAIAGDLRGARRDRDSAFMCRMRTCK